MCADLSHQDIEFLEHPWSQHPHHKANSQHLRDEDERDFLHLGRGLDDGDEDTDSESNEEHRGGDVEGRRDCQLEQITDLVRIHRLPHKAGSKRSDNERPTVDEYEDDELQRQ